MWFLLTALAVAADDDRDGWTKADGDCDDDDPTVHPTAPELCDGQDQDCDDLPDWPMALLELYVDYDADGYGCCVSDGDDWTSPCCVPVLACRPSPYYDLWYQVDPDDGESFATTFLAENPLDCHDGAATVYPGAPEVCDALDDDCDGRVDEDIITEAFPGTFFDADRDSYGGVSTWYGCDPSPPPADAGAGGDCDDGNAGVYPGAVEACNGLDDDCDGEVDANALGASTWYVDRDGDGFGDPASETTGCYPPPNAVENGDDTDDSVEPPGGCGCRGSGAAPTPLAAGALLALRRRRTGGAGCRAG